jgi:hypothetical protein
MTNYIPGSSEKGEEIFGTSLENLILDPNHRRNILLELRRFVLLLDKEIVDLSHEYLNAPDEESMIFRAASTYLRENMTRRPLFVVAHTLSTVLANPNFLQEFYLILMIFVQFKDVAKEMVAPFTLKPIYLRFFNGFYHRFTTFVPGASKLQTVDDFIRNEFMLLLTCISTSL